MKPHAAEEKVGVRIAVKPVGEERESLDGGEVEVLLLDVDVWRVRAVFASGEWPRRESRR